MKNTLQTIPVSTKTPFLLPQQASQAITAGLMSLIQVEGGPTPEQTRLIHALGTHILGIDMSSISKNLSLTPSELAVILQDTNYQRIFMQIAIVLDLCRHPKSKMQFRRVEEYAAALKFSGVELTMLRDFAHLSATDATSDFIRFYSSTHLNYLSTIVNFHRGIHVSLMISFLIV